AAVPPAWARGYGNRRVTPRQATRRQPGKSGDASGGSGSGPARAAHEPTHGGDGLAHAGQNRAAHDAVANVEFLDLKDLGNRFHIEIRQTVPGMHGEAE